MRLSALCNHDTQASQRGKRSQHAPRTYLLATGVRGVWVRVRRDAGSFERWVHLDHPEVENRVEERANANGIPHPGVHGKVDARGTAGIQASGQRKHTTARAGQHMIHVSARTT